MVDEEWSLLHRYKKTTAQLLIHWCLERGAVCIPKSVTEHRIIENANVFDFQISPRDMQVLVRVSYVCVHNYTRGYDLVTEWS